PAKTIAATATPPTKLSTMTATASPSAVASSTPVTAPTGIATVPASPSPSATVTVPPTMQATPTTVSVVPSPPQGAPPQGAIEIDRGEISLALTPGDGRASLSATMLCVTVDTTAPEGFGIRLPRVAI